MRYGHVILRIIKETVDFEYAHNFYVYFRANLACDISMKEYRRWYFF